MRFRSANRSANQPRRGEAGYVLLTLLLIVALMGILVLVATVPVKFANQRDQEQEMIHRGVQYSRAIRAYYKKFGRYPTKLEDLDNTNNLRYLRKHYKDPLNKNQDFRLLHYGEQGVTLGLGSIGGGTIPGATPAGQMNGPGSGNSAFGASSFGGSSSSFGGPSSFGNSPGGNSSFGSSGVNSNGVFSQSQGSGGNSNSFGATSNNSSGAGATGNGQTTAPDGSQTTSTSQDSSNTQVNANGATGQSSGNQLVSGGPIVGVASISKEKTIREFNKKKKYNEWQFVYDPATDRGGLITTPYQPALQGFGSQPLNGQNGTLAPGMNGSVGQSPFGPSPAGQPSLGQPGQSGSGQSSFGQSGFGQSGFGQSGFGSNPNSGGSQPPPQPPPNSQQ